MDGSFDLDLDALRGSLASTEHLLIRFGPISERLFLDFRASAGDGPGVFVLEQVSSFAERVATIRRVRPGLPAPERLHVVTWPLRVGALERLGVLAAVRARLASMDAFSVLPMLEAAYEALIELERAETQHAISGEGYHTLWPAARTI